MKKASNDELMILIKAGNLFGEDVRIKMVNLAFDSNLGTENEDPERVFFADEDLTEEAIEGTHGLARIGFAEFAEKGGKKGVAVQESLLVILIKGLQRLMMMLSGNKSGFDTPRPGQKRGRNSDPDFEY